MAGRCALTMFLLTALNGTLAWAQGTSVYVGALGGIATLSADGRAILTASSSAVSLYKPENGPAVNLFAGWDFSQFVSVQGNYIFNRNGVSLVSTAFSDGQASSYQEMREYSQSQVTADLLVYFRRRSSRVRPYLACGAGLVHLSGGEASISVMTGSLPPPFSRLASTKPVLRVPVGLDVALGHGWAFRYSFSESISSNPISDQLTPPGVRRLKNFQNLFGFAKHF